MHGTVGVTQQESPPSTESVWAQTAFSPQKLAKWVLIHSVFLVALIVVPVWQWSSFAILAVTSYLTMCVGVSVGMHRGLIHESFEMPEWLQKVLVYLSILPAVAGPLSLMRMHEYRDTYQSQPHCPHYFGYRLDPLRSYVMAMFRVYTGPRLANEGTKGFEQSKYFQWLERYYLWQQLPVALLLYLLLGWNGVFWGVLVRVVLCFNMVWFVNYVVHTRGYVSYPQPGCAEEGRNHWLWGILSFGEGWHNNHHAFPASARLGLRWWEIDIGYYTLVCMQQCGLVTKLKLHSTQAHLHGHKVTDVETHTAP